MKTRQLAGILLTLVALATLQRAVAQPLNLGNYPSMTYTQTFDTLGFSVAETNSDGSFGALPGEWSCYTNAHPTYPGSIVSLTPAGGQLNNWTNSFLGGFCNYASYLDYIGGTNWFTNNTPSATGGNVSAGDMVAFPAITNLLTQTNAMNRCLGIRQTGSFGDPFAAFVLKIADTTGYHNFSLPLDFINLDATSPRQAIWTVDWGVADSQFYVPTSFYPIAAYTNKAGTFHWFHTNIVFPDGTINNVAPPAGAPPNTAAVWIRIATLAPSTGSGNRETFAIDNVGLNWATGSGGCVAVDGSSGVGIEPGGIIVQPSPSTVYSNASATFTVEAAGTSPIYYQWLKDGNALSDGATGNGNSSILGSRAYQILINNVGPGDQGQYSCIISNSCGSTVYVTNSTAATFNITNPPAASIGFLHTLVDPVALTVTNSSLLWQATGIITTFTNTTTGNTASYYLQDGTGGINLFVTGGSAFRPQMGDVCTIIGFLSTFGGNMEIEADLTGAVPANNATLVNDYSNNIAAYPIAKVVPWDNLFMGNGTNGPLTTNMEGSVVILTNVYFGTNVGKVTVGSANLTCIVTNSAGKIGRVVFFTLSNDLTNRTIPAFAYSVQGPLIGSSAGYEIEMTRWADLVTTPLTLGVTHSGNNTTLTWTAVPLTYSYTVLAATSAAGPYGIIASGLKFTNSAASYTDTGAGGPLKFYRVTSP